MDTVPATGLIQAIQAFRKVYEHENRHLTESEREHGWKRYWNSISAEAIGEAEPLASPKIGDIVPSKRLASDVNFGMEPASKRSGPVGIPPRCLASPD